LTRLRAARPWLLPLLAILGVLLLVAACGGPAPSGGSGDPGVTPAPNPAATPLGPPVPKDLFSLFAWIFTPIFQALFIVLAAVYVALHSAGIPGAVGIAIIVLTLVVRTLLIPLFRRQLVSQRRMQMLQPELAEVKRRFKGDRMKVQQAQQEIMRERGVNPVSGCLPLLLQLPLLFIIYSVIQSGITNFNPPEMLKIAGVQVVPLSCPSVPEIINGHVTPCIDPIVPWLGGLNISVPEVFIGHAGSLLSGLGILSIISAVLQLIQSRMMLTPADPNNDDPNLRVQRQMMLFLPLISVAWGSILPAGLFIYWIVATLFSIIQQYLIVGWGAMFPLFGRTPAFATAHAPRFPVTLPPPDPTKRSPTSPSRDSTKRATSADKTIRPRERGRQGRRGRRR
jgi:YidC/Oxa1 family membrane protein insertase